MGGNRTHRAESLAGRAHAGSTRFLSYAFFCERYAVFVNAYPCEQRHLRAFRREACGPATHRSRGGSR